MSIRPFQLFILFLLSQVTGCQSSPQPEPLQYSVPADVESYVKAFLEEASKRNVSVSAENLIVTFGTAQKEDICGQCVLEPGKTPQITLNNDAFCWQQASQQERECLVFHELAHCLLKREHKADKFPNGAYVSLMNPNDVAVYATCHYPIGGDECDKRARREYYINELFDPSTPTPTWGK